MNFRLIALLSLVSLVFVTGCYGKASILEEPILNDQPAGELEVE